MACTVLLMVACSAAGPPSPGALLPRAQLDIVVEPNPIVALHVSENTYDFPFEIGIAERNGVPVEIQRVGIEVNALGSLKVYSRAYTRDEIASRGFPTSVAANGEIRYRFNPRERVPDERLFSVVSAELFVEGADENRNQIRATRQVTVRR